MEANQKKVLIIVGGLAGAYVVYRYVSGGSSASSTAATPDTSSTDSQDYASLAGQEQGDVAALQDQIGALTSQEQSDVAGLSGQEGSDVAALGTSITGLGGLVGALGKTITQDNAANQKELTTLAAGLKAADREAAKAAAAAAKAQKTAKKALGAVAHVNHDPKPSHKPTHGGAAGTAKGVAGKAKKGVGGGDPRTIVHDTHPKAKGSKTAKTPKTGHPHKPTPKAHK